MTLQIQQFYNSVQIRADISFLKYQLKKNCKTVLISGTGVSKLIEDCEKYLANPDIELGSIRAVHILYTLVHALKILWFNDVSFCQQLNSLNSGTYEYGTVTDNTEIYYKDLEFEIFTASMLVRHGLKPILPNHTSGNDIFCNDIEIQCKHPNGFNPATIEKYVRTFHSSLISNKAFGILALAIEDSFEYAKLQKATTATEFDDFLEQKRKAMDVMLEEILTNVLPGNARILGIMISASYYKIHQSNTSDFNFVRETNSVFCFRPDRKEIKDSDYKNAYKILAAYNPSPTMLTFEQGKLISVNNNQI